MFSLTAPPPSSTPPPPPRAPSVAKQRAQRAVRLWRKKRAQLDAQRAGAVSVGELLVQRDAGHGEILHPFRLDEHCVRELLADVFAHATAATRARVLLFLGYVAAACLQGKQLTGSHDRIAQLVGWAPRTGQWWIKKLRECGVLMVDATFVDAQQSGGHLNQRANLYGWGLLLYGAVRATTAAGGRGEETLRSKGDTRPTTDQLRGATVPRGERRRAGRQLDAALERARSPVEAFEGVVRVALPTAPTLPGERGEPPDAFRALCARLDAQCATDEQRAADERRERAWKSWLANVCVAYTFETREPFPVDERPALRADYDAGADHRDVAARLVEAWRAKQPPTP